MASGSRGRARTEVPRSTVTSVEPLPSAYPADIEDSRRLMGPNLLWDAAGAILDVRLPDIDAGRIITQWCAEASRLLREVGWDREQVTTRRFPGGANLAISAPLDGLFAATELNERAWAGAMAHVYGAHPSIPDPLTDKASAPPAPLNDVIAEERNPALLALARAAAERGVSFLADDDFATVGTGTGALSWPLASLPAPERVDWAAVHDIPVALITGSNGKTTTARLLTAIVDAAHRTPGMTSTDGIRVGGQLVQSGDYAGPGGARVVLRDRRVDVAVLETARGGILRRGLAVRRAAAALITNIAEDHLGEFGVHDLEAVLATKLVVARVVGPTGRVVLNADDPVLAAARPELRAPIVWCSANGEHSVVATHRAAGGDVCVVEAGVIVYESEGRRIELAPVDAIAICLGGAARHNVQNALGAAALALALGLPAEAIRTGLTTFRGTAVDNPGRLNCFDLGGLSAIVDFAHNPHGMDALIDVAGALAGGRKLILIGQAGDRGDDAIRALARSAWRIQPARIVIKEMVGHLRGRAVGEVSALLADEFLRLGAPSTSLVTSPSEYEGVRSALAWGRAGDLLVLTIHSERTRVLESLHRMQEEGWTPGTPVPE